MRLAAVSAWHKEAHRLTRVVQSRQPSLPRTRPGPVCPQLHQKGKDRPARPQPEGPQSDRSQRPRQRLQPRLTHPRPGQGGWTQKVRKRVREAWWGGHPPAQALEGLPRLGGKLRAGATEVLECLSMPRPLQNAPLWRQVLVAGWAESAQMWARRDAWPTGEQRELQDLCPTSSGATARRGATRGRPGTF